MPNITRRSFMEMAASIGAAAAWGNPFGAESTTSWRERRDLFAEGVASGDPDSTSVLLWTRYSAKQRKAPAELRLEVAEDPSFNSVVAATTTHVSPAADLTCRVLVGGLKPARIYWYRFSDRDGNGSRIGRTRTAPGLDDPRPVSFAFVSCQNVTQGAQNAYRRMIFEDERAPDGEQIGFVLHLGDFIYEITWYPEDRPQGMYDRKIREVYRYPDGEKIRDFHIPTTLEGYRTAYKGYLHDPDLQDARARWPFVSMWDNHEFSWLGWQSFQKFQGKTRAAQTRKVAANQAFFEYQPARMARPNSRSLEEFYPPQVLDIPITRFDDHGLGQESNNLAAIGSLKGYRAIRWGRNVELIVTDQRTYRSEEPTDMLEAKGLVSEDFPELIPEEPIKILDAARTYNGGHPPPTIRSANGDVELPNIWRERPPQTILGAEQKAWFLERLKNSKATWKIWGNTTATLDMRADPQNLPAGKGQPWPWTGYASFAGSGDHSTAFVERAEIYDFVQEHGITGFATVAGDRHSFWAGLAAKSLPPEPFVPVGIAFVTGSISAPGIVEAFEHGFPKDHPLRMLFLGQGPQDTRPQPTVNLLLRHGVRSCIEYQHTGDIGAARAVSNRDLSPHLSFVDMGGHGYSVVRATSETFETEFVCIPRPVERAAGDDGGPVIYRAKHSTRLWRRGRTPELKVQILEGDPKFSI
jgi:alkaline phosphatase D